MDAATEARPAKMMSAIRDWSALPLDILLSVFANLDAIDVLMGSGLVCHSWLEAAKVPDLWRSVDMANHKALEKMEEHGLRAMAKVAVDRSKGQLEVFLGKRFVTDELLMYIGDRSASLKRLSLISCDYISDRGFTYLITKSPQLEDLSLELCIGVAGRAVYEATGKACPQLKHFSLQGDILWYSYDYQMHHEEAYGIKAMRELRSLSLIGSNIKNRELKAILDCCPHLESLFLHDCDNIDVVCDRDLRLKCARIKTVTLLQYKLDSDYKGTDTRWIVQQYE
ncbi:unnamed protein product [Urochloa decumbens]|uniref:F-box domain-containing protein n=1 Tax=Urochloa decumbens TaxID=240449 RepID=A0ABC9BTH5_9POAL